MYYNPDNTVLRGRPETWLRGGWNRWTHVRAFPPQPMQPVQPGGTGFLQGTVEVSIQYHFLHYIIYIARTPENAITQLFSLGFPSAEAAVPDVPLSQDTNSLTSGILQSMDFGVLIELACPC